MAVQGKAAEVAYFDGGYVSSHNEYAVAQQHAQTSIPEQVSNLGLRNGCEPEPIVEVVADEWDRWRWNCPQPTAVELLVHGGGHFSAPPETTTLIWGFFRQHPIPE